MDTMVYRRVGPCDYDDVLKIRQGVYEGKDHLPSQYHRMLLSHQGYCAIIDGKMAAFVFVFVIDDGRTILTRCGRVSREYEGKGVFTKLNEHVIGKTKKNTIERVVTVVHKKETADNMIYRGGTLMLERVLLNCWCFVEDLQNHIGNADVIFKRLKICDKELLSAIFENEQLGKKLFPNKRFMPNGVPYLLKQSNIDLALSEDKHLLCSYHEHTCITNIDLLSISCSFECELGRRLDIDMFGKTANMSEIMGHITEHVTKFKDSLKDSFLLFLTYQDDFDFRVISCALKDLNFQMNSLVTCSVYGIERKLC